MTFDFDVVIVGLGPAGAFAAYELSRRGHRVLALERERLPRYKPCGGGLSVRAARLIPFDFSGQIEQVIHGATFDFKGEALFTVESSRPIAYTVSRDRFDFFLASKAKEKGAFILEGVSLLDWIEEKGEILVKTDAGNGRCRYLIGADGGESAVRARFPYAADRGVVGFKSRIPFPEGEERRGLVRLDLGTGSYRFGWFFPKKDHHSVGASGYPGREKNTGEIYARFVESQGVLKEASGQQVYAYRRAVRSGRFPLHQGRALLAGEAAGLIDPFSGEGIYHALLSGRVAAEVISQALEAEEGTLAPYTAQMLTEIEDEFRSARRLARLIYGWPETGYRFLESRKWIIDLYFEILRGRERYDHIWDLARREWRSFSWRYWIRKGFSWRGSFPSFRRRRKERSFKERASFFFHSDRRAHKRS